MVFCQIDTAFYLGLGEQDPTRIFHVDTKEQEQFVGDEGCNKDQRIKEQHNDVHYGSDQNRDAFIEVFGIYFRGDLGKYQDCYG